MLLGAASLSTKTVVKNIDLMLKQLGESFFAFNMQFDPDEEIVGDLEVKASGTSSLIQKDVRSQRILQLLQLAMNPALTPFANMEQLWRESVIALDLDGDGLSLDPKQAQIQAQLIGTATAASQAATAAGTNLTPDASQGLNGGGNIAAGAPPAPTSPEFSGNNQEEL